MTTGTLTSTAATSTRYLQGAFAALFALGVVAGALGCGDESGLDDQGGQQAIESQEEALRRGAGPRGLSYTCSSGGTCTCDKSIENDCANMSAVCTDGTVDALISCINGWLTTHCTCTQARVAPKPTGAVANLPATTATARK